MGNVEGARIYATTYLPEPGYLAGRADGMLSVWVILIMCGIVGVPKSMPLCYSGCGW